MHWRQHLHYVTSTQSQTLELYDYTTVDAVDKTLCVYYTCRLIPHIAPWENSSGYMV